MADEVLEQALPVHGSFDYVELAELGLSPDEVMDFSVNINPYGASPQVAQALTRSILDRYPDRACLSLRQAILQHELAAYPFPSDMILCGNGASELIWHITRAFVRPGDTVAILGPSFSEYAAAAHMVGAQLAEFRTRIEESFQIDIFLLCSWILQCRPRVLWICNPNNPTGTFLPVDDLLLIAENCMAAQTLLVVDESYIRFVSSYETSAAMQLLLSRSGSNVLVVRSLTKDYALAAVRSGYVVGLPPMLHMISLQLPSWNVSSLAQIASCAALTDRSHIQASLQRLGVERQLFFTALSQLPCKVFSSWTHFFLLDVGNAAHVRRRLLEKKIMVRDCTSFGLPQCIRVSTRSAADWPLLIEALREVL